MTIARPELSYPCSSQVKTRDESFSEGGVMYCKFPMSMDYHCKKFH